MGCTAVANNPLIVPSVVLRSVRHPEKLRPFVHDVFYGNVGNISLGRAHFS